MFLGQRMGSWQHREVQVALDRQAPRAGDFPVIPILLPGLDDEPSGFLSLQTWIDLRADPDDPAQLQNLIAAIHREAPEGAAGRSQGRICPYRGLLPFREEDAGLFFGRDDEIEDLVAKVQRASAGRGGRPLRQRQVVPGLRRPVPGAAPEAPAAAPGTCCTLRPGPEPLHALGAALSPTRPTTRRRAAGRGASS